jgi:hypothetical protein
MAPHTLKGINAPSDFDPNVSWFLFPYQDKRSGLPDASAGRCEESSGQVCHRKTSNEKICVIFHVLEDERTMNVRF